MVLCLPCFQPGPQQAANVLKRGYIPHQCVQNLPDVVAPDRSYHGLSYELSSRYKQIILSMQSMVGGYTKDSTKLGGTCRWPLAFGASTYMLTVYGHYQIPMTI